MRYLLALLACIAASPAYAQLLPTGCGPWSFSNVGADLKSEVTAEGFSGGEPLAAIRYIIGRAPRCHTDFKTLGLFTMSGQDGEFRAASEIDPYVVYAGDTYPGGTALIVVAMKDGRHVKEGDFLPTGIYRFVKMVPFTRNGFPIKLAEVEYAAPFH